ncbi:LysR family transcriptional regulator [Oceanospirillum sediminis]|uniref:LysR family transcriptional regulator n=1 Tax=Oceanospirillum sediminis TaxID=2760088 RepID=A0A839IX83_9GAMM|nr:LysR family transcriptional regulator [Oceanospirillum sediminis]MBB1489558.1 LysR family transcriptional regulator [Oceanospirillum sediminis]
MAGHKTTLEQWRILQAVVDHGGYTQAAEALFRSQSSLNHAVKKLESQLGVPLLEVKGRKAFLTEAGEALLRRSRVLTETATNLEKLADNITLGWEPQLTISVELAYPRALLHKVLRAFYPESRGTRLRIIDSALTGSIELLNNKEVDLAITHEVPKGMTGDVLCHAEFILVVHPDHELALESRSLRLQELESHLQIVIKDSARNPDDKRGWLKAEQRWTVDSFERAKQTLKQGLGFCWLPEHEVREDIRRGELKRMEVDYTSGRVGAMSLVVPNPDILGPGGRRLYELFIQHGRDE